LSLELAARSAGFRRSLPEGVRTALADLVREMNCYYSNLIEGHDMHPVDIERALKNDYTPKFCIFQVTASRTRQGFNWPSPNVAISRIRRRVT
jgi:hypothetical protein